jgi:uncharacterized protein
VCMKNFVLKPFLIALGWICLVVGIIGSFLPLLPTTPFILLAAYFFSKGSQRFYLWLIHLPKFGESIKNWNESGVIGLRAKIICVISISSVLLYLNLFKDYTPALKAFVSLVLLIVVVFVCTRPAKVKEKLDA